MQLGHPPADTAVFAPLMAALQELQVRRGGGGCLLGLCSCVLRLVFGFTLDRVLGVCLHCLVC
jgi:hypothetical protein